MRQGRGSNPLFGATVVRSISFHSFFRFAAKTRASSAHRRPGFGGKISKKALCRRTYPPQLSGLGGSRPPCGQLVSAHRRNAGASAVVEAKLTSPLAGNIAAPRGQHRPSRAASEAVIPGQKDIRTAFAWRFAAVGYVLTAVCRPLYLVKAVLSKNNLGR